MPPPPKKPPTKGAKQIMTENEATVNFYRNMAAASGIFYNCVMFGIYRDDINSWLIFLNLMVMILYFVCYQTMKCLSCPTYTEHGQLIDPGLDLNMEGGMGEHFKDIIIMASIAHVTAIISNYFWLLLLLIPARAFWLLWKNFLGPWFFQEAPEDSEQDEKKRRKLERRMRRHQ